jgi:hypothetical protein
MRFLRWIARPGPPFSLWAHFGITACLVFSASMLQLGANGASIL